MPTGVQWIGPLLVIALGLGLARRRRASDPFQPWLAPLILLGTGLILMRLFVRVALGTRQLFNATRVATSIAMARGYDIILGPDEGPVLDFMYGPVSAAAYMPASWSPTPSGAIWAGIAMSYLFVLGPFAWLAFARAESRGRGVSALAVVCLGVLCSYDPALAMVAFNIHADAPSIGLAACACACLLSKRAPPSTQRMLASALFAVLAVWAKQTAAPIVLALPAYVWLRDGWPLAVRFALCMGGVGAAASAAFVLWFGFDGILFTMFQMPGGHPWAKNSWEPQPIDALLISAGRLARTSLLGAALVVGVAVASLRRSASPLRNWLRDQPWTGLLFVGLLMLPISAIGGAKLGGDTNSYGLTTYFLMTAGVLGLAELAWERPSASRALALSALAGIVLFAAADGLRSARRSGFEDALQSFKAWRTSPIEQATAFAREHPDEVLFARNPLIGLYSDGLLYHSSVGFSDRLLAGFRVSEELRSQYVPAKLRYIGLLRNPGLLMGSRRPAAAFPTFTEEVKVASLPHHRIWVEPSADERPRQRPRGRKARKRRDSRTLTR